MASNNRKTKAERVAEARAKAQALREEQERKERRATLTRRGLIGLGAVAVAGVAGGLVYQSRASSSSTNTGTVSAALASTTGVPSLVRDNGSLPFAKVGEPGTENSGVRVLEVFYDYSCHFCAAFETLHSQEIEKLLADGTITLVLRPCKILGQDWTDQIMNAMGVVLDNEPEHAMAFHNGAMALFTQIYDNRDTSLMTLGNITTVARTAGVSSATSDQFEAAINANTYGPWTELGTKAFSDAGLNGTPAVFLDGQSVDLAQIATADGLTKLLQG